MNIVILKQHHQQQTNEHRYWSYFKTTSPTTNIVSLKQHNQQQTNGHRYWVSLKQHHQ